MSDRLKRLRTLRDNLTRRMDSAPDYAASGVAKVLVEVLDQIDELEAPDRPKPDTPLDEFTARMRAKAQVPRT